MTQPLTGPKKEATGFSSFECNETDGLKAYTFAQNVTDRLSSLGLGANPQRPRLEKEHEGIFPGLLAGQYFDGRLPTVIRRLSLDQVSALYSLYTNWYRYLVVVTRKVATERSEAIRQKEFIWSHIRSVRKRPDPSTGKKITDQTASDETRGDIRFVLLSAKYEEVNSLFEILAAMCEVAEQDMKVISREVTIQQTAFQQKFLSNNFRNRGERMMADDLGGSYGDYRKTVQPPEDTEAAVNEPSAEGVAEEPSAKPPRIISGRPRVGRGS
jgi:hypothetical protein